MIERKNGDMELWYNGILIHSHLARNKVWPMAQIENSVQSVINAKLPQPAREKIIRQGGDPKVALDSYFDELVDGIKDTLVAEAEKHRAALSYETMSIRAETLSIDINGLPEEVEHIYIDDEGVEQTEMIDNPLRVGYEPGHVRLEGLPLKITVQQYNEQGEPAGFAEIDNPERVSAVADLATIEARLAIIEENEDVMAIVANRAAN